jgi:Transposase DDE domain
MYAYTSICIPCTIQKKARKPSTRRPHPCSSAAPLPLLHTRCSARQLLGQFHKLLPASLLVTWMALSQRSFYARAFTPLVSLWYLVFQRLSHNHHLSHVQEDAREGGADRLSPPGKALSSRIRSESTSAYSDARQRLPLEVCRRTLGHIGQQFAQSFKLPQWFGLQAVLLDGSTYRLRPFGNIPQQFPPHRPGNCKKSPYWCVARVVGLLCLSSGAVLDSAVGCLKTSEQALSATLLQARSWAGCLLLGDRNFGVYSMARAIVAAQGQALLRLTRVRAAKLAKASDHKLRPGLDVLLNWSPSRYDQCPEKLTPAPVPGRLLVVRVQRPGFRALNLYLFTTLVDPVRCPAQDLVRLYGQRWTIEVCFRYIKAQMELGFLECYSADMARKEWFAGLIAYNLIRWTMASAAALAERALPRLSFSRTRELLLGWLVRTQLHQPSTASWKKLLSRISKAQLPKRRKPLPSEPRAVRPFRKDHVTLLGSRAAARKILAQAHLKS